MYNKLSDKAMAFNQHVVDTIDELELQIEELGENPHLRFRGVNEAKYTMQTSLQRNCPVSIKLNQREYLTALLNKVKNDPKVIAFFQQKRIAINDISCLALMQHSELPTPLLDFTTDIEIALSFAMRNLKTSSEGQEIDEYASLYFFDTQKEFEVGASFQLKSKTDLENGESFANQCNKEHIDDTILHDIGKSEKWEDLKDIELIFIEYPGFAPCVVTLSGQRLDLSNRNLEKQKGCFVLNLYKDTMPLEENWNSRTRENRINFWSQNNPTSTYPYKGVMTNDKISCYDIRKEVLLRWTANKEIQLFDDVFQNSDVKKQLNVIKKKLDENLLLKNDYGC